MSVSVKTEKMLWGRAANRCAICQCELVVDATETDDESLVGDACHIVAKSSKGSRGESDLTPGQRNKYSNLILLCKVHHKIIDDQPSFYTVVKLREIKANHEKWVRESLSGFDSSKQRDEELYASYIDEWEKLTDIENWNAWTSFMLSPQPHMTRERLNQLNELRNWILSRIWPKRYEELESAFTNFRIVLSDFVEVFCDHAKPIWEDRELMTEKFYHIDNWDPKKYQRLLRSFHFHVDLLYDLTLELTRSANYVCDKVRHFILASYRLNEGVLLVTSGPTTNLQFITQRPEYKLEERGLLPYPGLEEFKIIREKRDYYFGKGESSNSSYYLELVSDADD